MMMKRTKRRKETILRHTNWNTDAPLLISPCDVGIVEPFGQEIFLCYIAEFVRWLRRDRNSSNFDIVVLPIPFVPYETSFPSLANKHYSKGMYHHRRGRLPSLPGMFRGHHHRRMMEMWREESTCIEALISHGSFPFFLLLLLPWKKIGLDLTLVDCSYNKLADCVSKLPVVRVVRSKVAVTVVDEGLVRTIVRIKESQGAGGLT
jgi:hypothetical protein